MGKGRVLSDWFSKKDANGYDIEYWATKVDNEHIYCKVCSKTISVASAGFDAVKQHAAGKHHIEYCANFQNQLILRAGFEGQVTASASVDVPQNSSSTAAVTSAAQPASILHLYSVRDKDTIAELRWVLKCVSSDFSASSCDGVADLFQSMFGDVAKDFSLSRTKARYLISDALGPHFRDELLKDMSGATYTVSYDETTNSANSKELQIGVTYFSEKSKQVRTHHLETFFIGSATAEVLAEKINEAIDNADLPRSKLLMLGRDGPAVNGKVERLINDQLIEIRKTGLVKFGSCNIHIIHNAFLAGLKNFGNDASDLVFKLYYFFHQWPLRRDDFRDVQCKVKVPEHTFLKHVNSRWLTLEPAVERVIEQWPAVTEYFLKFIPKNRQQLKKSKVYDEIVSLVQQKNMLAQLHFVHHMAKTFTRFTGAFQSSEPMIHILYDELSRLARTLLGRVCKNDSINELGFCEAVLDNSEHWLPLLEVKLGTTVKEELEKLDEKERKQFFSLARSHIKAASRHVITKSALGTPLLKKLRCLQPAERTSARSTTDICAVAKALPFEVDVALLEDEWLILQNENETITDCRIDTYWSQFFDLRTTLGDLRYPTVATVVKAALALSHGNADMERGFSDSSRFLSDDKASMSVRVLNAAMTIKSALKRYGNQPHKVPIPKELLALARNAHASYKTYLEEQRRIRENIALKAQEDEERRKTEEEIRKKLVKETDQISKDERALEELKKNESAKRKTEEKIFTEATKRLKKAIERKDLTEVGVVHAMLEGASRVRKEIKTTKGEVDVVQKTVEKSKSSVISNFLAQFKKRK